MRKRSAQAPRELRLPRPSGAQALREPAGHEGVSFGTARLEPRLGWAIAAFTVWAAVVLGRGEPQVWLLALYAAAIAGWSRVSPARHPAPMLVRAGLLLAGAFVVQASLETAAYAIWPVMVTAIYSLLLPHRWAVGLWALALVEFVAARALAAVAPPWQAILLDAGVLVFFSFIAMEFGRFMRALDRQAELSRKDRASRLYNEAGFFTHGGELFDECRRRRRPFAMALLNSTDLREVADLVGKKAANQLFAQLVQRVEATTPRKGLAARTDATEFALALPRLSAARAATLLHEQLGQPPRVEVVLKGRTITVMLDAVVAEASADVPTLEDMYDRLRAKLPRHPADSASAPADMHSTLQGMLEIDPIVPHHARPTMPMGYGELTGERPHRR